MLYQELWEEAKDCFESQFNLMIATENYADAYIILGELMRFKMIDKTDSRLEKKYLDSLKIRGVDTNRRFVKDMRLVDGTTTDNFLPDSLYENELDLRNTVNLEMKKHWTVRRELVYVGDIIAEPRTLTCQLSGAKTESAAMAYISDICTLYKNETGRPFRMDTINRVRIGEQKLYKLVLTPGEHFTMRDFGYVIVDTPNDKITSVSILLNNKELYEKYIPIKKAHEEVENVVTSQLKARGENLKIRFMCNPERYYKKQAQMIELAARPTAAMEVKREVEVTYSNEE